MGQIYVTTRQRAGFISGGFGGSMYVCWGYGDDPCAPPPPPPGLYQSGFFFGSIAVGDGAGGYLAFNLWQVGVSFETNYDKAVDPLRGVESTLGVSCSLLIGFGTTAGASNSSQQTGLAPKCFNWPCVAGDGFKLSYTSVHCFEFNGDISSLGIGPNGWPLIDGTEVIDGPGLSYCRFHERYLPGSTVSLSVQFAGLSAACSLVIPAGPTSSAPEVDYSVQRILDMQSARTGGSISVSASSSGGAVYHGLRFADATHTVDDNAANITLRPTACGSCEAHLLAIGEPPRQYILEGQIECYTDSFPGSLQLELGEKNNQPHTILACAPGVSYAFQQAKGQAQLFLDGNGTVRAAYLLDEHCLPQCYVKKTSLAATGDDQVDQRILYSGRAWNALTIQHKASLVVNACSALAGWAAAVGTTLGGPSPVTLLAGLGGNGTGTLTQAMNFEQYRFLRLTLKANAAMAITVTIGTKTWTVNVTTTQTDFDLDLCCPGNAVATSDGQNSRWPLVSNVSDVPVNEGPLWGVNEPASIKFSGITAAKTLSIYNIQLARKDFAGLDALPEFNNWETLWTSGGTTTAGRRSIGAYVDARMAAEVTDMYASTTAGVTTYTQRRVADIVTYLQTLPGFTVTDPGTVDSWATPALFNNAVGFACYLGGYGWIFNGATWASVLDVDITGVQTIQAQLLIDVITTYPGCGDPWATGGIGASLITPLAFRKELRALAYGIGFNTSDLPFSGLQVSVFPAANPADIRGTAKCDALGCYLTALPYAKGALTSTTIEPTGVSSPPSVTEGFVDRKRYRAAFRTAQNAGQIHLSVDDKRGYTYGVVFGGGAMDLLRISPRGRRELFSVGADASAAQIGWRPHGELLIAYVRSAVCYVIESRCLETTWSAAVTVRGTGTGCALAVDRRTGLAVCAVYDTGIWYAYRQQQPKAAWESLGAIVTTNTAGQAGMEFDMGSVSGITLIVPSASGLVQYRSLDKGNTWSLV